MNSSSDAAESVVRMSLQGTEVALRITGSAAKELTAIFLALSKNFKKIKGKTSLSKILKSGGESKVFSIRRKDLKKFMKAAKKYGILYHVLIDKKQSLKDGLVDIIVKAADAPKINRIFERYNLSSVERATVQNEKTMEKSESEKMADDILNGKGDESPTNPVKEESEKNPQSENSSNLSKEGIKKTKKKSVRETLQKLRESINKENISKKDLEKNDKIVKKSSRSKKIRNKSKQR